MHLTTGWENRKKEGDSQPARLKSGGGGVDIASLAAPFGLVSTVNHNNKLTGGPCVCRRV